MQTVYTILDTLIHDTRIVHVYEVLSCLSEESNVRIFTCYFDNKTSIDYLHNRTIHILNHRY